MTARYYLYLNNTLKFFKDTVANINSKISLKKKTFQLIGAILIQSAGEIMSTHSEIQVSSFSWEEAAALGAEPSDETPYILFYRCLQTEPTEPCVLTGSLIAELQESDKADAVS